MKKKLPFKYPPLIDSYSGDSGRVAVQLTSEYQIPILIVNHLTLCYYPDSKTCGFNWDYYNEETLEKFDIKDDLLDTTDIKAYLKNCINSNYYVHLFLDQYYIKNSGVYQTKHKIHDNATIFGYDESNEFFYVADNFQSGKYLIAEVNYKDVEEARKAAINTPAIKFKLADTISFNLEIDILILILKGHLEGKFYLLNDYVESPCKGTITYGIDIYNILKNYLKNLIEGKTKSDIRSFHVMANHKSVLLLLVEYLSENGQIENANDNYRLFKEIEDESIKCRNLLIKYNINGDTKLIDIVISKIDDIIGKEKYALNYLINSINERRSKSDL